MMEEEIVRQEKNKKIKTMKTKKRNRNRSSKLPGKQKLKRN